MPATSRRRLCPGLLAAAVLLAPATTLRGQSADPTAILLGAGAGPVILSLDTGCAWPGARQWRANVEPRLALAGWLNVSPTGAASASGIVDVEIGADASGLALQIYTARITFTSTTDCAGTLLEAPAHLGTVDVTLDLLSEESAHRLEPQEISFHMTPGGPPLEQTLNFATACQQGVGRTWQASISPPRPWLTVAPDQGTELISAVALNVRADLSGLNESSGPHVTTVTVTSTDCAGLQPENPEPGTTLVILQIGSGSAGDFDGDGSTDDADNCPVMPNPDQADTDLDQAGDVCDECPLHAEQTAAGSCGCGQPTVDRDLDGAADCLDECPDNPSKTEAGLCGCLVADLDADGDGRADCVDGCPTDESKTEPGLCGCGLADDDVDEDQVPDCADDCPLTPYFDMVDERGCGSGQSDSDYDGLVDLFDECPGTPIGQPVDRAGCAVFELDTDSDGVNDAIDQCPQTSPGADVDYGGCPLPGSDPPEDGSGSGGDGGLPRCPDGRGGRLNEGTDCSNSSGQPPMAGPDDSDGRQPLAPACGALGSPALIGAAFLLLPRIRRRRNGVRS